MFFFLPNFVWDAQCAKDAQRCLCCFKTMAIKDDLPDEATKRRRERDRAASAKCYSKKRQKRDERDKKRIAKSNGEKVITGSASALNKEQFGLKYGFAMASKYFTVPDKQKELENEFYRWKLELPAATDDRNGRVMLTQAGTSITLSGGKYVMYLNRNYGTEKPASLVRWISVDLSELSAPKSGSPIPGHGAFAERQFVRGDIVGVYVGIEVQLMYEDYSTMHSSRPYCMAPHGLIPGVNGTGVDAQGGVGSRYPIGMGMHIMNDPHFYSVPRESNPNKKCSANVEFTTDGVCVATRKIEKGAELLVHYNDN